MTATIDEVRGMLWMAYEAASPNDTERKHGDGLCEVKYPRWADCKSVEEMRTPTELLVYSYALGPSRQHMFYTSNIDKQIGPNTWLCRNVFQTAGEVIGGWMEDRKEGEQ